MQERGAWRFAAIRVSARGAAVFLLVVAALLAVVAQSQARVGQPAGPATVGTAALSPETFSYTGGEQTYTVPAGVTSLQVQAFGAKGGNGVNPEIPGGGAGGLVIGYVTVAAGAAIAPGDTLYVEVGGTSTGPDGGFNGGGSGEGPAAGGGGGATDLRACSRAATSCLSGVSSLQTRLIVAGGGGGVGSEGAGGAGGAPGRGRSLVPDIGGSAGTLMAPGGPGIGFGNPQPGSVNGTGGNGGKNLLVGGGGGGGGYSGGGGGAIANGSNGDFVSGGGGGGASFASPLAVVDASFYSFPNGGGAPAPALLITPRPASAIRVSRIYYNSPGPDTGTNQSLDAEFVRLTNTSRTAQQLRGWSISDSYGHVYRFGQLRLRPGASVTVHSGRGRDTRTDRYWNRRRYVWDNTRDLVRVHTAQGKLADQCRYDNSHASQIRCWSHK